MGNWRLFLIRLVHYFLVVFASHEITELCPLSPQISLTNLNRRTKLEDVTHLIKDYYTNSTNLNISSKFFKEINDEGFVQITCLASNPIEIEIDSQMAIYVQDQIITRTTGVNFSDTSSYCYNVTVKLKLEYSVTGNYICQKIDLGDTTRSSLILFVNDKSGSALLTNSKSGTERLIEGIPDDNGELIIPCIVTDPFTVPLLFAIAPLGNKQEATQNTHYRQYVPSIGFIISVSKHQLHPIYLCELGNEFLNIRLKDFEENGPYRVSPNEKSIDLRVRRRNCNTIYCQLTCESNKSIEFLTNIWSKTVTEKTTNTGTFYTYKITLTILADSFPNNLTKIDCKVTHGPVLYTWYIFKPGSTDETKDIGIRYVNKYFMCISSQSFPPLITLITCANPINCETAKKFAYLIHEDNDFYPFQTEHGYTCPKNLLLKSRRGPQASKFGCAVFATSKFGHKNGLVYCKEESSNEHLLVENRKIARSYYLSYYTEFNNKIVTNLIASNTNELLRFYPVDSQSYYYEEEKLTFVCEANAFVYSKGMYFEIHFSNGTASMPLKDYVPGFISQEESISRGTIRTEVRVQLFQETISRMYCFAPVWNTFSWRNVSILLNIVGGERVYIHQPKSEIHKFNLQESNRSISCSATGDPPPGIEWTKDGKSVEEGRAFGITNNGSGSSTLYFKHQIGDIYNGTYICIAASRINTEQKLFHVIVETEGDYRYLVGVVVGLCILIILIVAVSFFVIRRQNQKNGLSAAEIAEFLEGTDTLSSSVANEGNMIVGDYYLQQPFDIKFKIAENDVKFDKSQLLGQGQYGSVWRGTYQLRQVAVKTVKTITDKVYVKALLSELKIMCYLGTHKNVIQLVGAVTDDLKKGKLMIVLEFCELGDILTYVRKVKYTFCPELSDNQTQVNYTNVDKSRSNENQRPFTTQTLVTWCKQIALGMDYLASKSVIHGDLAARNVLLASTSEAKVTDFGLSRRLYDYTNYVKKQQAPLPWRNMAIESLKQMAFSVESDIWSFGVTMWEIFTLGDVPYGGKSWTVDFVQELELGLRLPKPTHAPDFIYNWMTECWHPEKSERPNFKSFLELETL